MKHTPGKSKLQNEYIANSSSVSICLSFSLYLNQSQFKENVHRPFLCIWDKYELDCSKTHNQEIILKLL